MHIHIHNHIHIHTSYKPCCAHHPHERYAHKNSAIFLSEGTLASGMVMMDTAGKSEFKAQTHTHRGWGLVVGGGGGVRGKERGWGGARERE